MAADMVPIKRSSESMSPSEQPTAKRQKQSYHHYHKLQHPLKIDLREPAITEDATVAHLMNRAIGQIVNQAGFDLAEPVAMEGLRLATEEFIMHFTLYVRQSMSACRRIQPIPQDFELALSQNFISLDDLSPYLKLTKPIDPVPTILPSPPPENDPFDDFAGMPILDSHLSGEDDRVRNPHIPPHFPQFPSKHTYRHTPIFTEREIDPRKLRERATEDGRYGEEALRKLARAAFKDAQGIGGGRDKRLWGRRNESAESMFEKTMKALTKKAQKTAAESAPGSQGEAKAKAAATVELGPIVNCERSFWRKPASASTRKSDKLVDVTESAANRTERWAMGT